MSLMMPRSIFCIYFCATCNMRRQGQCQDGSGSLKLKKVGRGTKEGWREEEYMLELSTRRWLSKVLLIKIKFIACLLIKMKTDAGRGTLAPAKKLLLAARERCCSCSCSDG